MIILTPDPKTAALQHVAWLLCVMGRVARLSRRGEIYTIHGGQLGPVTYRAA